MVADGLEGERKVGALLSVARREMGVDPESGLTVLNIGPPKLKVSALSTGVSRSGAVLGQAVWLREFLGAGEGSVQECFGGGIEIVGVPGASVCVVGSQCGMTEEVLCLGEFREECERLRPDQLRFDGRKSP